MSHGHLQSYVVYVYRICIYSIPRSDMKGHAFRCVTWLIIEFNAVIYCTCNELCLICCICFYRFWSDCFTELYCICFYSYIVYAYSICTYMSISHGHLQSSVVYVYRICIYSIPRSDMKGHAFRCVTWLFQIGEVAHSNVWYDSFRCVTWLMQMCDMTHSDVWGDSFRFVTRMSCESAE